MRAAFTLIEIIFVLVVFGILAVIGTDILVKVYENYLISKSVSNVSYKLDVALLQIAKRLSNRIRGTEIARDGANNINTLNIPSSTAYNHIEWIGRAYEARRGKWDGTKQMPGWSGFADLSQSSKQILVTPGSNLTYAKDIISSLYQYNLDAQNNGCAALFYNSFTATPIESFGWDGDTSTNNAVFTVYRQNDTTLAFDSSNTKTLSDIYELSCTAYALRHTPDNKLVLYYHYRPWMNETYQSRSAKHVVLIDNVTTFQVRKRDRSIEVRLCIEENATDVHIEFCGKKVIF